MTRSPARFLTIVGTLLVLSLLVAGPVGAVVGWQHVPPTVTRREAWANLLVTAPPTTCGGAPQPVCGDHRLRFEGRIRAEDGDQLVATSVRRRGASWDVIVPTRDLRGTYEYRFVVSREVCTRRAVGDAGLSLGTRCRWTDSETLPAEGWYSLLVTTGPVGWNLHCGRGCASPAPPVARAPGPAWRSTPARLGGPQP